MKLFPIKKSSQDRGKLHEIVFEPHGIAEEEQLDLSGSG